MAAATGCALGTIHTQPPKVEDSSNSSASTPEKPQGTLKVTFAEGADPAAVMPEVLKVCRKVERDVEIAF